MQLEDSEMKKHYIIALSLLFLLNLMACKGLKEKEISKEKKMEQNEQTTPWPEPQEGFKKVVINLEEKADEYAFKVELFGGKEMMVDCNKARLNGEIVEETLAGWGYNYYSFKTDGNVLTTLMACPEGSEHLEFVQAAGKLIRYNSKLPIVVYVPKEYEVRYRIWQAGELMKP